MYKVFFNDSSIQIGADVKKSFKNNILPEQDFNDLSAVSQFVNSVESAPVPIRFYVPANDSEAVWKRFRSFFTEFVAAGGLVKNDKGEWLFIRRFGKWDLPKGKIEKKETAEMGALREVSEECGLSGLKLVKPLGSTFHIYRSPFLPLEKNLVLKETKWFLMDYSGNEKPVPQSEEDIMEVRWVKPDELDEILKNVYSSLREFLEKRLPAI